MKTIRISFAVMMLAELVRADAMVEPLGIAGDSKNTRGAAFHLFGGRTAEVEVAVEAPLGTTLSLRVALFQIAGGVAAPVGSPVAIEPMAFDTQTRRLVHAPIPLPEVKSRAEFLARFQTQIAGAEGKTVAGQARLFLYPQDQIEELALSLERLEKDAGATLSIFGESQRVRAFLEQSGIPFTDCGAELPSTLRTGALYVGEADARFSRVRNTAAARIVVFSADSALLPGVYTTIRDSGLFTKVTLPILDALATNPQSQRAFIDVLRHSLDASAITPGDSP